MIQEEKELLLKDLSARLPYGVMVSLHDGKRELIGVLDAVYPTDDRVIVDNLSEAIAPINVRCGGFLLERDNVKPYLRPISSMTEEERQEYQAFFNYDGVEYPEEYIDWLNKKMFAYRTIDGKDMFELGLVLKAPKDMYNLKEK